MTGSISFILAQVPRAILPLPFVEQSRMPTGVWTLCGGIAILAITLPFTLAAFRILPWSAPNAANPLRTDGWYAIVRHPLMFRHSFWPLGWSLIFGAQSPASRSRLSGSPSAGYSLSWRRRG